MARLSAEEAFGILRVIGKLSQTVDAQAEYIAVRDAQIRMDADRPPHPPQDPEEGGEKDDPAA